jgi:hypothetical protein
VQNHQSPLTQNSSKYFDYPLQHYDVEVFPYQDHEEEVEGKNKKLKRRQEFEGKTRS